jgi:hypothetical protein
LTIIDAAFAVRSLQELESFSCEDLLAWLKSLTEQVALSAALQCEGWPWNGRAFVGLVNRTSDDEMVNVLENRLKLSTPHSFAVRAALEKLKRQGML